jgi:hypothetical protein
MTRRFSSQMTEPLRIHSRRVLPLLLLALLLWTPSSRAMDLVHYDLDSLGFMSTDIVVCKISADGQKNLAATVTETLYGSLHPGDRIERLTPFLMFFQPMEDGMNAILFLDHRPHTYDFFHSVAAKSPYAVAPSGVYLIDSYGHTHQYFQQSNPGPYVAEGYTFFIEKKEPSEEEDTKLPTLAETKSRIASSIRSVDALRPLLDKVATREDIPQLFALLKSRTESRSSCGFRSGDAIVERLKTQIRSFNDPDLLLRLRVLSADVTSDISFVQVNTVRDAAFTSSRVAYLLRVLADKKVDSSLRVAAAETLLGVSRFHSGPQNRPAKSWLIDNEWVVNFAEQIRDRARTIFDDQGEEPELRSLCLQFLPLDDAKYLADVKRVYAKTHSSQLRFAIEEAFLRVSDSLYEGLTPSGGPVTSIIIEASPETCVRPSLGNTAFVMKYNQRQDFHDTAMFTRWQYVLTNSTTHQRIAPVIVRQIGGWSSMNNGEGWFELSEASDLLPGTYALTYEVLRDGKVLSSGYPLVISVKDGSKGKVIVTDSSN